jgi:hypothetical protein
VIGLLHADFRRVILNSHSPKTLRKQTGGDYHDCSVIQVRRSSSLYRPLDGCRRRILAAGGTPDMPD